MLDAETKYASAAAELEKQRFALAERDFLVQHITAFADRRVEDARCYSAPCNDAMPRGYSISKCLRPTTQLFFLAKF